MLIIDIIFLALLAYGVMVFLHYKEQEEEERKQSQNANQPSDSGNIPAA